MLSFCVCLFAVSCDDDDTPDTPDTPATTPTIAISDVIPDVETITFTLTTEDATAYEYGCITTDEFELGAIVKMTRQDGNAPTEPIKITGLKAETAYTIVARAFNGDVSSKKVSENTTTLAAASEAPVLTISEPVADDHSVSFKITHTGEAAKYNYAVYEKSAGLPEKFLSVAAKDEGADIQVSSLKASTTYVIEAYGEIGEILGDHVQKEFTTTVAAIEVEISDITSRDAHLRVTMNKEMCAVYYLGGYPTSAPMTNDEILELVKTETASVQHNLSIDNLFSKLDIDGMSAGLEPETTYIIWWVAFDADNDNNDDERNALTASNIRTTNFTTKGHDLTSPATITGSVEAVSTSSVSVKFTPSSDAVKYYTKAITANDIKNLYSTDALLAKYLISMGSTEAGEKTIDFNPLTADTDYVFCAIAEDKDGKFSVPLKVEAHTKGYEFDSPVVFTLEAFSGTVVDPQENAQFVISSDDLSNVQEIRYMNLSRTDYSSSVYLGKDENVRNGMLRNTYPTKSILPEELTRGRLPKFEGLKASTNYYCFAIILDKDGKYTEMQKISYKTASYDQTGAATATWEIAEETQALDYNGALLATMDCKLRIIPSAECVESWAFIMERSAFEAQTVQEVIRQAKTQGAGWYGKGTTPWITDHRYVGDNYVVIVICKDKDGKYNNISRDVKEIENKYSKSENPDGPSNPDVPNPGGKGNN